MILFVEGAISPFQMTDLSSIAKLMKQSDPKFMKGSRVVFIMSYDV